MALSVGNSITLPCAKRMFVTLKLSENDICSFFLFLHEFYIKILRLIGI